MAGAIPGNCSIVISIQKYRPGIQIQLQPQNQGTYKNKVEGLRALSPKVVPPHRIDMLSSCLWVIESSHNWKENKAEHTEATQVGPWGDRHSGLTRPEDCYGCQDFLVNIPRAEGSHQAWPSAVLSVEGCTRPATFCAS